jgi:hypothetical protein
LQVRLLDRQGNVGAQGSHDLAQGRIVALDTSRLTPGKYMLKAAIRNTAGKNGSPREAVVDCLAGPLLTSD